MGIPTIPATTSSSSSTAAGQVRTSSRSTTLTATPPAALSGFSRLKIASILCSLRYPTITREKSVVDIQEIQILHICQGNQNQKAVLLEDRKICVQIAHRALPPL